MSIHLKRLSMPRAWKMPRKTMTWVTSPRAGPHSIKKSIPLLLLIRDFLKHADNSREARQIIGKRMIYVDGKPVSDYKRPIGLMDVLAIPSINEYYRILFDKKGHLRCVKIPKKESTWKFSRIENKKTISNNKIQLNMHDGRNILIDKNKYKTGDVLKIKIPTQDIIDAYELNQGHTALIIGGKHNGQISTVDKIEITKSPKPNLIYLKEGFSTIKNYVFIVGRKSTEIQLPEEVN